MSFSWGRLVALTAAAYALGAATPVRGHAIPPLAPGAYAVGCSNVEQDFTRIPGGDSAEDYWEGIPKAGTPRYLTDLLVDRANALVVQQTVPNDSTLYGPYARETHPFAMLVCYPTAATNPRPHYVLPTGFAVPHMQRGAEPPIFADPSARHRVLLFSHGLSGSPISEDHIDALKLFASHGYVVIAPFHGDPRFADVKLENFEDVIYALIHFKTFVAMQALRPLSMSAMLTAVMSHPHYRDHVDPAAIGGFGASLGGESMLLMAGAALTTSLGQSSNPVLTDSRLKAAVGYVPYFGIDGYPAFGRDHKGLDGVTLPYLAISGTADTTSPIGVVTSGIERLTNTRLLVALTGVEHGFDTRFSDDIFTWSLAFLAGQLSVDPVARAASARMTSVAGGGEDVLRIDYVAPSPPTANERQAIEYYSDSLAHYFVTAEAAEAAMLDAGVIVPGWRRTGYAFNVHPVGAPAGLAACRFFGTPPAGPNSHFFTIDAAECAKVKANPLWTYEGLAFHADAPVAADCLPDRVPVTRLYNNGMRGQANHRYTTSRSAARAMHDGGWIVEGPVFCAIP